MLTLGNFAEFNDEYQRRESEGLSVTQYATSTSYGGCLAVVILFI
jgi:hypothetical protein